MWGWRCVLGQAAEPTASSILMSVQPESNRHRGRCALFTRQFPHGPSGCRHCGSSSSPARCSITWNRCLVMEEKDGCMLQIVATSAHLSDQVEAIKQQHDQFGGALREILTGMERISASEEQRLRRIFCGARTTLPTRAGIVRRGAPWLDAKFGSSHFLLYVIRMRFESGRVRNSSGRGTFLASGFPMLHIFRTSPSRE